MKKAVPIIVIIAIIIIGFFVWKNAQSPTDTSDEVVTETEDEAENAVPTATGEQIVIEEATEENTTPAAVEASLEGIDLGDLELEFETIDEDLDSLGL